MRGNDICLASAPHVARGVDQTAPTPSFVYLQWACKPSRRSVRPVQSRRAGYLGLRCLTAAAGPASTFPCSQKRLVPSLPARSKTVSCQVLGRAHGHSIRLHRSCQIWKPLLHIARDNTPVNRSVQHRRRERFSAPGRALGGIVARVPSRNIFVSASRHRAPPGRRWQPEAVNARHRDTAERSSGLSTFSGLRQLRVTHDLLGNCGTFR